MSFKKINIPYKETGLFSKVLIEYVDGDSKLKPFYEYAPTVKGFGEAIKNVSGYEYPRKLLATSFKEYYKKNAPAKTSDATLKNIQKLEDKNCFTVTTGHQLCLFTGPLYFIFKIVSAINLAEKLNKEYPKNHFVPIYWMASEDHDFAEINHANLLGKKVEWNIENTGGPVGKIPLTSLKSTLDNLFSIIGEGDLKSLITESYSSGKTLAEATFSFVNSLFGKYGLVVIEPDNKEFKQVFSTTITDELVNETSNRLVNETCKKLAGMEVKPQVHSREINLFYIDEHGRNRIEKKNNKFEILNTDKVCTQDEITALVKKAPEKFSPNVLLRPVYQQCILPNVAYIGGPSEIAYWLELKSVFMHYKVPFPVLMPRNSALVINKPIPSKIDKLKLTAKDLFKDTESLIKEVLKRDAKGVLDLEKEADEIKKAYTSLTNKAQQIDPTLAISTQAQLQKQLNALKALEVKLMRVKKKQEETAVLRIRNLKEMLFPGGALQERTENFIPFYMELGEAFFDLLKESFDPFDFSVQVFIEE